MLTKQSNPLLEKIWVWLLGWRNLDFTLLFVVTGLTVLAGLAIRSATLTQPIVQWQQHWVMGGLGLVFCLLISRLDYRPLVHWHWLVYMITNVFLIAVIFLGVEANGAQSWINIGGFNLQPSEFAKLGLIITLAAMLQEKTADNLPTIFRALAIAAVPWCLIMVQPDLGTGLVFAAISLGMLYWANANLGWILLMMSPLFAAILANVIPPVWWGWTVAMGIIAWSTLPKRFLGTTVAVIINLASGKLGEILWGLLKPYQKDRLTLFLHPEKDPLNAGYHLIQSRIAIGSGEMWGQGLNQGTQTQLNFIPEQHTDFIFSAIGEELGFFGAVMVVVAFWLVCLRLVIIACRAQDNFGSLMAIGVLSMVVFQVLVNVGMTIGVAPITGIPLPWLSYGRSSLLTNFLAIGVVEAVYNYREE